MQLPALARSLFLGPILCLGAGSALVAPQAQGLVPSRDVAGPPLLAYVPAPYATATPVVRGRYALTSAGEQALGADENGDGDQIDQLLVVHDLATRQNLVVPLAIGSSPAQPGYLGATSAALPVSEERQGGVDLNGDGDADDYVLHLVDYATGASQNLGLAVTAQTFTQIGVGEILHGSDLVVFKVTEAGQSGLSLNGDGDAADDVLHVLDPATGVVTNLGLATVGFPFDGENVVLAGDRVVFLVDELQQGADLDGDGLLAGGVLHVFEAGQVQNLGWNGHVVVAADDVVAVLAREVVTGVDLDGNGAVEGEAVHVIDPATGSGATLPVQLDMQVFAQVPSQPVVLVGGLVVVRIEEAPLDRNGDGDADDVVVVVFDPATGILTDLGRAVVRDEALRSEGDRIAYRVDEAAQGSTDLNGDGDASDRVAEVFDLRVGALTTLARATAWIELKAGLAALLVDESDDGVDHNGDGFLDDRALFVHDAGTGAVRVAGRGASGSLPTFDANSGTVAFGVDEVVEGADVDGDGSVSGNALVLLDRRSGAFTETGFQSGSFQSLTVAGNLLSFFHDGQMWFGRVRR